MFWAYNENKNFPLTNVFSPQTLKLGYEPDPPFKLAQLVKAFYLQ